MANANAERIEQLRLILAKELRRDVSVEEASLIGEQLISFYENLLDNTYGFGLKKSDRYNGRYIQYEELRRSTS